MEEKFLLDKSGWGEGEWQQEPDWAEWIDYHKLYLCRAIRHEEIGCWRGYVGVPQSHPCFGLDLKQLERFELKAYGGVNYADTLPDSPFWWFGFHCGIGDDRCPGRDAFLNQIATHIFNAVPRGEYRNLEFVQHICELLALQLYAIERQWVS